MSGYCGIYVHQPDINPKGLAEQIATRLKNCGNDREGHYQDKEYAVVHRALWATPEACYEFHPLVDQASSLIVTGDIRIDNRRPLLSALNRRMHSGDTVTDLDIMLAAYMEWGTRCFTMVEGDYSVAILEKSSHRLVLARDPIGFRPLYYVTLPGYLAFATEIRPLLALDEVSEALDGEALQTSLVTDAIPPDRTYFHQIRRLPAGSYLDCLAGMPSIKRYWSFSDIDPIVGIAAQEAAEELRSIFQHSVAARCRSHRPVGVELSGGIDSSSVAAIVAKISTDPAVRCYSLRSRSAGWDEGPYIDALARKYRLRLDPIWAEELDYGTRWSLRQFYSEGIDWPADLMFMPHIALAEKAGGDGIGVILTGQGGDEVTQGSPLIIHDYFRNLHFGRAIHELRAVGNGYRALRYNLLSPMIPDAIKTLLRPIMRRHASLPHDLLCYSDRMKRQARWIPDSVEGSARRQILARLQGDEPVLWRDSSIYQLYQRYGIDVRHPFYDIRLVKFCLQLPAGYHFADGRFKSLFRRSMQGLLPDMIRERDDKAEFTSLILQQLAAEKVHEHDGIEKLLAGAGGLFDPRIWSHRRALHAKANWEHHEQLLEWKLLNLVTWRRFSAKTQ